MREIGLRQALGADRALVIRDVIGSGLKLAVIGSLIGLAAAFGLTRFISSLLFEVGGRRSGDVRRGAATPRRDRRGRLLGAGTACGAGGAGGGAAG